jgi:hypothetical protein
MGAGLLGLIGLLSCRVRVGVIWTLLVPLELVRVAWMELWPSAVLCGLLRNENGFWSLQIVHDFVVTELKIVVLG